MSVVVGYVPTREGETALEPRSRRPHTTPTETPTATATSTSTPTETPTDVPTDAPTVEVIGG